MLVYNNFLNVMKSEKVTFAQLGALLGCRYQTVSDIVNGETKGGFLYDDAILIQKVFFPKYNHEYLFLRVDTENYKPKSDN